MTRIGVTACVAVAVIASGCGKTSESSTNRSRPTEARTYEMPSSSMEPTIHCARPAPGCQADTPDRVEIATSAKGVERGDVIVFNTPPSARRSCGAGGIFIKRVLALPGETWSEKNGYVYVDGAKLDESYVTPDRRDLETHPAVKLAFGDYFVEGDNRTSSCDSRVWGPVPRANIIGRVTKVLRPE